MMMDDENEEGSKKPDEIIKLHSPEDIIRINAPELVHDDLLANPKGSESEKFAKIKSMLKTLDKFLARKFLIIFGIYIFGMGICVSGLFALGSIVKASNETSIGGHTLTLKTWLWSIITVMTLIVTVLVVYWIARNKAKKNGAKN